MHRFSDSQMQSRSHRYTDAQKYAQTDTVHRHILQIGKMLSLQWQQSDEGRKKFLNLLNNFVYLEKTKNVGRDSIEA